MQFVTVGNYGFIKFLKNISLNFQQQYMRDHEILIFCLGEKCYSELSGFKIRNNFTNVKLILKDFENNKHMEFSDKKSLKLNPEFVDLNNLKFSIVSDIVSDFDVFHYIDSDVGFLSDPQKEYEKLNEYDLVFQSDVIDGSFYKPNQCAGNFLIRRTKKAGKFVSEVKKLCSKDLVDQKALNEHIRTDGCVDIRSYQFADITCFDPKKFPNGYYAFHQLQYRSSEVICLHANYLSGESAKIDALAVGGVWYMDGSVFLFFRRVRFFLRRTLRILKILIKKLFS
jgi:hypothetical protein